MTKYFSPLLPLLFIIVVGEYLAKTGLVPAYILPAPSEVLLTFQNDFGEYLTALKDTLSAAFLGLVFAALAGVSLSLFLALSKWLEMALYPYATFFQTVPIVSIAPLLVIWFGFGLKTVIISAFIVSIFPIIANTLAGLNSVDPALLDLFKLYSSSKLNLLFKLRLPHAVPQILTGLKISAGLAMIGAVIGEFIAGGGLGGIIDASRTQQRLDKVFAAVLLASFAGLFLILVINLFSKLFLTNWRLGK
ncbi:MAG: ABC transporter permease [Pseudobdellovibrio sp.]